MASNSSTRRTARQKATVDCPSGSWSVPIRLGRLARSGLLSRFVLRAPAGTASTAADIKVWMGGLDDATTVTDADTDVADEDTVLHRTSIVVAGSATAASDDYDILVNHFGASYDVRGDSEALWLSIKSTGAEPAMVVSLEAVDVK